jgi:Uma2 family endonuclease
MTLTVQDLEKLQAEHPDWRMELVDGEIIVMSPCGYESDEVSTRFATLLNTWVMPRQIGRVTGSSAGFILPNSDTRAPDVSFVLADRLRRAPQSFAELMPDLVVEVKSPPDNLSTLQDKIQSFLSLGAKVGILVNPEPRTVDVYHPNQAAITLRDGDRLAVPELLPGWEIAVSDLWSPVFE